VLLRLFKSLPVDFLKIDGASCRISSAILRRAMVDSSPRSGECWVSDDREWVENDETLRELPSRIDYAQGYGVANPRRVG